MNKQPKLTGIYTVTVKTFDNATASLVYSHYDMMTRRNIPQDLGIVEQPAQTPFYPSELLVMAACEWLARDITESAEAKL